VGAIALAEALVHNIKLESISLGCCRGISVAGARAFAGALRTNRTLLELDLQHTGVDKDHEVLKEIEELLQNNRGNKKNQGAKGTDEATSAQPSAHS
jgi:hypothetical protein